MHDSPNLPYQPWKPQEWCASAARSALIAEGAHTARLALREILDHLWIRRGYLPRRLAAAACGLRQRDAERAITKLLELGALEETPDGLLFNGRVLADLEAAEKRLEKARQSGGRGGAARRDWTAEERSASASRAARGRWPKPPVQRSDPSDVRSDPSHDANASEGMRSQQEQHPDDQSKAQEQEQEAVGDEELAARVEKCRTALGLDFEVEHPTVRSLLATLSRAQLNRAVEALRKAEEIGSIRGSREGFFVGVCRKQIERRCVA